jgi:hypothetical protein
MISRVLFIYLCIYVCIYLAVVGMKPRASHMLDKHCASELHLQSSR